MYANIDVIVPKLYDCVRIPVCYYVCMMMFRRIVSYALFVRHARMQYDVPFSIHQLPSILPCAITHPISTSAEVDDIEAYDDLQPTPANEIYINPAVLALQQDTYIDTTDDRTPRKAWAEVEIQPTAPATGMPSLVEYNDKYLLFPIVCMFVLLHVCSHVWSCSVAARRRQH
jgi:hypothetical protein